MTATLRQVVPAAAEGPGWWSRRPWLGMFLGGLGLWVATVVVTFVTGNLNLVPTIILLGSFLVPVAVVSYGFGHADPVLTAQRIFTAVVSGGVLGIAGGGGRVRVCCLGERRLWLQRPVQCERSVAAEPGRVRGPAGHPDPGGPWAVDGDLGGALFAAAGAGCGSAWAVLGWYGLVALLHGLWDASQGIAVWLTLVFTGSPAQWLEVQLGQAPAVTSAQLQLFTILSWGLLALDALLGVLVLRGRWHRATAPDRPPPAPPTPLPLITTGAEQR